MINRGGMSDIVYYRQLRNLGLSEEYFFSLPYECQRAIIMAGYNEKEDRKQKINNIQKKVELNQYLFEEKVKEKVKEKVLTLLKKKK